MQKAEMYDVYEKEVTVLILENSRLKESLSKEKEAGQILKKDLESVTNTYNTVRLMLLILGLCIIAYVIIKIRSRS